MSDDTELEGHALLSSLARRQAFDEAAVTQLADLGEAAVPALEAAIEADEPATAGSARRLAIRALARIGCRAGVATLLNVASAERDADAELVVLAMRGAIAALGPADGARLADFFASFVNHDDDFVRAAVADGVAKAHPPNAAQLLVLLAGDADDFAAERAILAIEGLELDAPPADAGASPRLPTKLLGALASRKESARLGAIRELVTREDAVECVVETLAMESHRRVRSSALEAAVHLRSPELYDNLCALIESPDVSDDERVVAFHALALPESASVAEAVERVRRFSRREDVFLRAAAVAFGMRSGAPDIIEVASRRLNDRDAHVRELITVAFRDSPSSAAAPAVVDRLKELRNRASS